MMPVTSPPLIEHGVGDRAHQADRAAAVDQPDAVFGENGAELAGASTKRGSVPGPEPQ